MNAKYTLALCQFSPSKDSEENFGKAAQGIRKACGAGARVVCLPEIWNSPYGNEYFKEYAEEEGGNAFAFLSNLARENRIVLIGGSIPERAEGKLYNTSFIFGPGGELIGKHRKAHLFDIDIPGGTSFRESDTLTPGGSITVVNTEFGKIGVAICFDIRFPEMFSRMADAGCHLIALPAAFSMSTGPYHWELLVRARAVDNQCYLAACAPARAAGPGFKSYAHSIIADPWGDLRAAAATEETVIFGEIDLAYMEKTRRELPVFSQRSEKEHGGLSVSAQCSEEANSGLSVSAQR
ncbi:MAG: carbon-nitrogen hydrolase family protein [Clostridiales Family XIII bacterium]|jgi:omega-amidase|nr:carbon-nitrogen hydrolase family protein [Clostridiales Family XIII bacterium]